MAWLDRTPLAVLALAFFLILLICVEVGYRGYRWTKPTDGRPEAGHEFLLSAVLGLLALLLGFTFSMSVNRYDARRDLVVQEANALGTTWLRVQLLDDPSRTDMSGALKQYVDARIAWSQNPEEGLGPTNALQEKVWAAAERMARATSPVVARGVLDPLNEAIDLQATRKALRAARIPERVLRIILIYSAVSMVMLGYTLAVNGNRRRVATSLLLVLVSLAFLVILDLDRPRNGAIQVSQQPLLDLRASMK